MTGKTKHTVINGDSRNLSLIDNEAVQLVITSPPYWQLKDYGSDEQIGYNDSYEDYINNLNLVWNECFRILSPGCRLCINIGDQFARSVYYGRYKVIPIRTEIIKFCETNGFDYMGAVIWQKVTNSNTSGGASIMGSFPYPRNGILKLDYEFILLFKKPGEAPKPSIEQKKASEISKEEWNQYFTGHWNFGGAKQDGHIAMFPEELPHRLIKMFSFAGETVFDPFLGSGTTSLAAKKLGRNSIGYEINPNYIEIIKSKLQVNIPDIQGKEYIFQTDDSEFSAEEKIKDLKYIFKDPIQLNKKIDPKTLSFGQKIDGSEAEKNEFFTIQKVISPQELLLNNGLSIKLLGINDSDKRADEAVDFLVNKTKGQKVFLRYDEQKYDSNNILLCYVYLKNKTFINAHLIKAGLAEPDINLNYRYKDKFVKLYNKHN